MLPINAEILKLEEEYQTLLDKEHLTAFETNLLNHLHDRCNRLWKKISLRGGAGPYIVLAGSTLNELAKSGARPQRNDTPCR